MAYTCDVVEPRVSEWDREYFRRIGEWKAESHRLALERASASEARQAAA